MLRASSTVVHPERPFGRSPLSAQLQPPRSRSAASAHLKNPDFRIDHNSEDRWQPRWKFPWGVRRTGRVCRVRPPVCLAVATTGLDNAMGACLEHRRNFQSGLIHGQIVSFGTHLSSFGCCSGRVAKRSPSRRDRAAFLAGVGLAERTQETRVFETNLCERGLNMESPVDTKAGLAEE
jgi:hypothetical protein